MTQEEYARVSAAPWELDERGRCVEAESYANHPLIHWMRNAEAAMVKHGIYPVKDENGWYAAVRRPQDSVAHVLTHAPAWHPFAAVEAAVQVLEGKS